MKFPVKIEPERIKDAIVQVFFTSQLPVDLVVGYVHPILQKLGYVFIESKLHPSSNSNSNKLVVDQNKDFSNLFVNKSENIKIQFHKFNAFSFNILQDYFGWPAYQQKIETVINELSSLNVFTSFSRVGFRYISEFENISILNKVKISLDPSFVKEDPVYFTSNIRFDETGCDVNLKLISKLPTPGRVNNNDEDVKYISIIDIDVIKSDFNILNSSELIQIIDTCHTLENKTFFNFITPDFLKELNPKY
ncbi:MAG: TIGR04255 family protein [Bacteroidales bacterium]